MFGDEMGGDKLDWDALRHDIGTDWDTLTNIATNLADGFVDRCVLIIYYLQLPSYF